MTRVVVDANLAVSLVVPLPYSKATRERLEQWTAADAELLAPMLWGYEITSALRKVAQSGRVGNDAARSALEAIFELGVVQVAADDELHAKALAWAERLGHTAAYDAAYVALAEDRDATLWTADNRLVRATQSMQIDWVRSVSVEPVE